MAKRSGTKISTHKANVVFALGRTPTEASLYESVLVYLRTQLKRDHECEVKYRFVSDEEIVYTPCTAA